MSRVESGLQLVARQRDQQAADRGVQKALATTFAGNWGLLPEARKPGRLESTEPGERRWGWTAVAIGAGLGGLWLVASKLRD